MSDPYVGEIRMFGGSFAPSNWAFCNGQIIAISQNSALFSLLGTTYGGDGRVSFGLPEMRGRLPVHQGAGPGLTPRRMGEKMGHETVALNINQIPAHSHAYNASTEIANSPNPANDVLASQDDGDTPYAAQPVDPANLQAMNSQTLAMKGQSQPHSNMMPYLPINFIICLFGIYPPRS